jgi:Transcriptional regulatory protein, C terminal
MPDHAVVSDFCGLRISRTVFSALSGTRLPACLIVAPQRGYDEPGILSYAISSFYPTSADGLHGSRAYDILLALLERPGELVTKEQLIARVWPNTFVESVNLAVQVAGLRRALGDRVGQARYVINIPGRGYRFVAPLRSILPCLVVAAAARDSGPSRWNR